jgi:hypothetical protein
MSDTLMSFVPAERAYVPPRHQREQAVKLLRSFLPAAEEVAASFSEEIRFLDCGGNWSGVRCPRCGGDAEGWFEDELSRAYEQTRFRDLAAVAPCCGGPVSLDALTFGWPVGFARFVLEARNPGWEGAALSPEQHQALEQALGCVLQVVWRHY